MNSDHNVRSRGRKRAEEVIPKSQQDVVVVVVAAAVVVVVVVAGGGSGGGLGSDLGVGQEMRSAWIGDRC